MNDPAHQRTCAQCGTSKPLKTGFYKKSTKNSAGEHYYEGTCKSCIAARNKKRRESENTRTCKVCHQNKPEREFHQYRDNIYNTCKKCRNQKRRELHAAEKQRIEQEPISTANPSIVMLFDQHIKYRVST